MHRPKLLYTVPTFHNPTGRTLPLARRRRSRGSPSVPACGSSRTIHMESSATAASRSRRSPSLPEAGDRTIAISTLSKIAAPGLRLGWVRAPRNAPAGLDDRQASRRPPLLNDRPGSRGTVAGHAPTSTHTSRGCAAAYGARRDALLDGLASALPPGSTHNRPEGGMFVWARLPDGSDASDLLPRALERDVAYVPGEHFFSGAPDAATLRLSFTAHPPEEIRLGLERLAGALAAATRACRRTGRVGFGPVTDQPAPSRAAGPQRCTRAPDQPGGLAGGDSGVSGRPTRSAAPRRSAPVRRSAGREPPALTGA